MAKLIYDNIIEADVLYKPRPRVRVRLVELEPECVGVVFSQNRFPERYPEWEVLNEGAPITILIELLATWASTEWNLVPPGKRVRWFEHYSAPPGLRGQNEGAIFDEVVFAPQPVEPQRNRFQVFRDRLRRLFFAAVPLPKTQFSNPNWKRLGPDAGTSLVGFEI